MLYKFKSVIDQRITNNEHLPKVTKSFYERLLSVGNEESENGLLSPQWQCQSTPGLLQCCEGVGLLRDCMLAEYGGLGLSSTHLRV